MRTLCATVLLLLAAGADACSVPVFRYALERWSADDHLAHFTEPVPAPWADWLASSRNRGLNIAAEPLTDLPVGRVDIHAKGDDVAWFSATPDAASLAVIGDSPARRELVRRLLTGDNAVWLLIESGDRARDDAAETLIRLRLREIERIAELPERDPEDPRSRVMGFEHVPVRIGFSHVRVRRDDPAEAGLVAQVLRFAVSEGIAAAAIAGPLAVPVFGRGRALIVHAGDDLANESIDQSCLFLIGSCACEVKEQNPGRDLLIACDWETESMGPETTPAPSANPETSKP